MLYCPSDITTSIELGTWTTSVYWMEPMVIDASGILKKSATHKPGYKFTVGLTNVSYTFEDKFHNRCECNFSVNVVSG